MGNIRSDDFVMERNGKIIYFGLFELFDDYGFMGKVFIIFVIGIWCICVKEISFICFVLNRMVDDFGFFLIFLVWNNFVFEKFCEGFLVDLKIFCYVGCIFKVDWWL